MYGPDLLRRCAVYTNIHFLHWQSLQRATEKRDVFLARFINWNKEKNNVDNFFFSNRYFGDRSLYNNIIRRNIRIFSSPFDSYSLDFDNHGSVLLVANVHEFFFVCIEKFYHKEFSDLYSHTRFPVTESYLFAAFSKCHFSIFLKEHKKESWKTTGKLY